MACLFCGYKLLWQKDVWGWGVWGVDILKSDWLTQVSEMGRIFSETLQFCAWGRSWLTASLINCHILAGAVGVLEGGLQVEVIIVGQVFVVNTTCPGPSDRVSFSAHDDCILGNRTSRP